MYPHIIISDLSFETIVYSKEKIMKALYNDYQLGVRFQVPLRDVEVCVRMQFDGGALPHLDSDDNGENVSHDDWNAGWDTVDQLYANGEI